MTSRRRIYRPPPEKKHRPSYRQRAGTGRVPTPLKVRSGSKAVLTARKQASDPPNNGHHLPEWPLPNSAINGSGLPRFANEILPASAALRSCPAFLKASVFSCPRGHLGAERGTRGPQWDHCFPFAAPIHNPIKFDYREWLVPPVLLPILFGICRSDSSKLVPGRDHHP